MSRENVHSVALAERPLIGMSGSRPLMRLEVACQSLLFPAKGRNVNWRYLPLTRTQRKLLTCGFVTPVGFQKSVTAAEQGLHAARSYSLIKPSRTGRHVIRS
jgi:hypothetical protein